ncbi:MAG: PRC-barrel domain containing protein [candidate division Zixibacteria bacterium]|nr:PRC-barrel domain containing protein [candidate division Zixibacteria bacterium]
MGGFRMNRSTKNLQGHKLKAIDGKIGKVETFYFDDVTWTIRYVVADTGKWLPGKLVLLSTEAFEKPDWNEEELPVSLTKDQIENSPDVSQNEPVSRQKETEVLNYYETPIYWMSPKPRDAGLPDTPAKTDPEKKAQEFDMLQQEEEKGDIHLRDTAELIGYRIRTEDSEFGSVEDIIIDDGSWEIVQLVIDTAGSKLEGKKVIITPEHIKTVNWVEATIITGLTTKELKENPEFEFNE